MQLAEQTDSQDLAQEILRRQTVPQAIIVVGAHLAHLAGLRRRRRRRRRHLRRDPGLQTYLDSTFQPTIDLFPRPKVQMALLEAVTAQVTAQGIVVVVLLGTALVAAAVVLEAQFHLLRVALQEVEETVQGAVSRLLNMAIEEAEEVVHLFRREILTALHLLNH